MRVNIQMHLGLEGIEEDVLMQLLLFVILSEITYLM